MAKAKKTWKLILTSIILSIIVLAAFTAVFISIIVPSYDITREQIYSVLTKALPILIGLIFIEIALISSRRGDDDYKDNIDKLSPNAYDSPLYTAPVDDPNSAVKVNPSYYSVNPNAVGTTKEVVKEVPVEVIKEVIKEVPVEIIREVPVEVEKINTIEVPVVKEVVKEVPVEVIKEVEVPVIKEVPVERIVERKIEVPVEVVKEVEVPVVKEVVIQSEPETIIKEIVKEVPVEIIKEVEIPVEVVKEVPVEVIKEIVKEVPVEVIKEVEVPVEVMKEVEVVKEVEVPTEIVTQVSVAEEELSLQEALQEEIDAAKKGGYALVLIAVKNGDEVQVSEAFESPVFSDNGVLYVILPFTRIKDVAQKAKELGGKAVQMTPKHTAETLMKEASR